MPETTIDKLLNGRLSVLQPKDGYRIAVDTLLLAAAAPVMRGDKVMDLGCGVGGVMLAMAARVSGIIVTGVEIQPELAALCALNIEKNGFKETMSVIEGDATRIAMEGRFGSMDHVVMNPPFHDSKRHDSSPNDVRRIANIQQEGEMGRWIGAAASVLREGGVLTTIARADREKECLEEMKAFFGSVTVKFLLPKIDKEAKRVIIRSVKGGAAGRAEAVPLVLHNEDGTYTQPAEAILRNAQEMEFY